MHSVFVLLGLECWRIWKARPITVFLVLVATGPFISRLLTGETIRTSGVNSIRSILLGAVIILLAVRSYPVDFEYRTFRTILLQGIQRKHFVIARVLSMTLVASITFLPWEINRFFANQETGLVWMEFGYSIVLDLSISLGFASVFTVAVLLGKESFGALLGVLFYVSDLALFFLTQTTPPVLAPDSLGGAGAILNVLSNYSLSVQGLQYSYPELYGKSSGGMIYFLIISAILTLLSVLLFEKMDFSR